MDIVISGLNNCVGRRCTSLMADTDFRLFAITRNRKLFEDRMSEPIHAQVFEVDLLKDDVQDGVGLPDIDASFYFTQVPALDDDVNLRVELLCLRNFIRLIKRLRCNRLVYVTELTDKRSIEPILDLLREFQIDYKVVLKNLVVGKDCWLYHVYQQLSSRKIIFYSNQYSGKLLQPIGIHDLVRWLKALLFVVNFPHRELEVGGGEVISAVDFYRLYRELTSHLSLQRMVSLPNWLLALLYRKATHGRTATMSFLNAIQIDGKVENNWDAYLTFSFTPLKEILLAE